MDRTSRTVGIDLASADGTTGVCTIEWGLDHAVVTHLDRGKSTTDELVSLAGQPCWVAIDAPFGFPSAFSETVTSWADDGQFPIDPDTEETHRRLIRRETDVFTHDRLAEVALKFDASQAWPLSSVVERITVTTMRAGWLVRQLLETPVSGGEVHVIETYPNAVLGLWNLLPRNQGKRNRGKVVSYKGTGARFPKERGRRAEMVAKLLDLVPVEFPRDDWREALADSDDCLDAFVCALMARYASRPDRPTSAAAALHHQPDLPIADADWIRRVEREGWIHLPFDYVAKVAESGNADSALALGPIETLARLWDFHRW